MRILHKLVEFGIPREDLKTIYILYVRSHLEQSCQVWHSSLTLENLTDLERVQKKSIFPGFHPISRFSAHMASQRLAGWQLQDHHDRHHQPRGGQPQRDPQHPPLCQPCQEHYQQTNGQ